MLCKKIYKGETGRRLADRFRQHLRDLEKNDPAAPKPVARHFNLPSHSHYSMTVCRLSLHHGSTSFNWVHSIVTGSMNASHSTNLFPNSCHHISTNGKPLYSFIQTYNTPQFLYLPRRRANARIVSFLNLSRW